MSIGFVLGNGKSREDINLPSIKRFGKIYACNAVYREFEPDYLIAVDAKMVHEINLHQYQLKGEVWTNYNKSYEKYIRFNYFEPSRGWSSGPTALDLASKHECNSIYILGFDYQGLGESHTKVNNIYSGTLNYKKITDNATYYGNWLRQTTTVIQQHPKIRYIRVTDNSTNFIPDQLKNFKNLSHISVNEFKKSFNILSVV